MKKAYIVTGLLFGDENKGGMVNYLTKQHGATLNVRHSGGSQCAHNVTLADKHHTFRQIGSGSFNPGVATLYGKHALFDPMIYSVELQKMVGLEGQDFLERKFYVHEQTQVITVFHRVTNRLKELARSNRHGSCGQGIGEARNIAINHPEFELTVGDFLGNNGITLATIEDLRAFLLSTYIEPILPQLPCTEAVKQELLNFRALDKSGNGPARVAFEKISEVINNNVIVVNNIEQKNLFDEHETVIFEGNQGVLLDQDYGFHPHNTWTDTTSGCAWRMMDESGVNPEVTEVGVMRSFMTRHGAGPLPSECPILTQALKDFNNPTGKWQGPFRVGQLDLLLLRYAMQVNKGVDEIAISHMDWVDAVACSPVDSYKSRKDPLKSVDSLPVQKFPHYLKQCELADELGSYYPASSVKDLSSEALISLVTDLFKTPVRYTSNGPLDSDITTR